MISCRHDASVTVHGTNYKHDGRVTFWVLQDKFNVEYALTGDTWSGLVTLG